MWSLASQRERRTSCPENFQVSAKRTFSTQSATLGHRTIPSITSSTVARSPARRLTRARPFLRLVLFGHNPRGSVTIRMRRNRLRNALGVRRVDRQASYVEAKLASVAAHAEFVVYLVQ